MIKISDLNTLDELAFEYAKLYHDTDTMHSIFDTIYSKMLRLSNNNPKEVLETIDSALSVRKMMGLHND